MQTTNLISTPNIEGNIGSCAVQSVTFKNDFWHEKTVATNSCTGEIVYESVCLNGDVIGGTIMFLFVLPMLALFLFVLYKLISEI